MDDPSFMYECVIIDLTSLTFYGDVNEIGGNKILDFLTYFSNNLQLLLCL